MRFSNRPSFSYISYPFRLRQNRFDLRQTIEQCGRHFRQRDEVRALNAWLRERERRGIDSEYLFPGRAAGLGISRTGVFELFKRYAERAGLPADKRHPHTLKHSLATHMLELGADVRDVQDLLGHAEIDSTLIYASITNKRRDRTAREVATKLPNF